ncbi:MAG: SfiI family type II restriction endonuclease, partial [Caldilineaceae bacterium]|nr:SfiI family type II restriction endonuclease [Caldilineaceae bacterium]
QTTEEPGSLPTILQIRGQSYITTTIFVKYNYSEQASGEKSLENITLAALPNGLLQDIYNPDPKNTIWLAGRNAPSLGEPFRVRLSFASLKKKRQWRVQYIPVPPGIFTWDE